MSSSIKRYLAVFTTLIYATTQVVLASAVETNVWVERRRTQVASLPASFGPQILNQMPAVGTSLPSLPNISRKEFQHLSEPLRQLADSVLPAYGTIQEVYDSKDETNPPVVLVQDIHLNPEAQNNIAALLQDLINQGQVKLVGVEGAFNRYDFNPLRASADKEKLRKLSQAFLDQNRLAAPCFVGINSAVPLPRFEGIDDMNHYEKNVQAYLDSQEKKVLVQEQLKSAEESLAAEKKIYFSPEMRNLDTLRIAHQKEEINMGTYVEHLSQYGSDLDFSVERFLAAYRIELKLDFKKVDVERKRVVEKLTQLLSEKEIQQLIDNSLAYRLGHLGFGAYYTYLRNLCEKKEVSLKQTPAFDEYIRYVLLSDGINASDLFAAVHQMEKHAVQLCAKTKKELEIAERSEHLGLVGKLVEFSLTPEEWRAYRSTQRGSDGMPLAAFEAFYEEADIRSRKMAMNLKTLAPQGPVLMIAGGFHTQELKEIFKNEKISYLIVSPKITKGDALSGSAYLSVFAREKTPLEKIFAGEKLSINPAAVVNVGASAGFKGWFLRVLNIQMKRARETENILEGRPDGNQAMNIKNALIASLSVAAMAFTFTRLGKHPHDSLLGLWGLVEWHVATYLSGVTVVFTLTKIFSRLIGFKNILTRSARQLISLITLDFLHLRVLSTPWLQAQKDSKEKAFMNEAIATTLAQIVPVSAIALIVLGEGVLAGILVADTLGAMGFAWWWYRENKKLHEARPTSIANEKLGRAKQGFKEIIFLPVLNVAVMILPIVGTIVASSLPVPLSFYRIGFGLLGFGVGSLMLYLIRSQSTHSNRDWGPDLLINAIFLLAGLFAIVPPEIVLKPMGPLDFHMLVMNWTLISKVHLIAGVLLLGMVFGMKKWSQRLTSPSITAVGLDGPYYFNLSPNWVRFWLVAIPVADAAMKLVSLQFPAFTIFRAFHISWWMATVAYSLWLALAVASFRLKIPAGLIFISAGSIINYTEARLWHGVIDPFFVFSAMPNLSDIFMMLSVGVLMADIVTFLMRRDLGMDNSLRLVHPKGSFSSRSVLRKGFFGLYFMLMLLPMNMGSLLDFVGGGLSGPILKVLSQGELDLISKNPEKFRRYVLSTIEMAASLAEYEGPQRREGRFVEHWEQLAQAYPEETLEALDHIEEDLILQERKGIGGVTNFSTITLEAIKRHGYPKQIKILRNIIHSSQMLAHDFKDISKVPPGSVFRKKGGQTGIGDFQFLRKRFEPTVKERWKMNGSDVRTLDIRGAFPHASDAFIATESKDLWMAEIGREWLEKYGPKDLRQSADEQEASALMRQAAEFYSDVSVALIKKDVGGLVKADSLNIGNFGGVFTDEEAGLLTQLEKWQQDPDFHKELAQRIKEKLGQASPARIDVDPISSDFLAAMILSKTVFGIHADRMFFLAQKESQLNMFLFKGLSSDQDEEERRRWKLNAMVGLLRGGLQYTNLFIADSVETKKELQSLVGSLEGMGVVAKGSILIEVNSELSHDALNLNVLELHRVARLIFMPKGMQINGPVPGYVLLFEELAPITPLGLENLDRLIRQVLMGA